MRAQHLLENGRVRPGRRLLAMTFTNRARDNLRNRLVSQLGPDRVRASVTVANFHEISARLLEAHHRTIGLATPPSIARAAWQRRAFAEIAGSLPTWQSKSLLDTLKREPLTDEALASRLRSAGDPIAERFQQRLLEEGFAAYGDLQRYAQQILRNDRVAALFQEHFDAILVDEFQDLSSQQFDIAMRLCSKDWTYVGDPYQGIFGWAGADPLSVHTKLRDEADEIINLDVSFRSSPAVLAVVNATSADLGAAPLRAANPDKWRAGGQAYASAYPTREAEAAAIAKLTDYLAEKYPNDTVAVICRTEPRREALKDVYASASYQPQYWDIALDTPRIAKLLKAHARAVPDTDPFVEQVARLRDSVLSAISSVDVETVQEAHDACDQILAWDTAGESVRALVARIRDHQVVSAISPGVHVLNAHVGKGQQFDWVIVMGLEEGHVPDYRSKTAPQVLEDHRVLLVMLSRARQGLFLTRSESHTNQYGRAFADPASRWWPGMAQACSPMSPPVRKLMSSDY